MNDFQRGYILAYFKDHQQDYSFYALANNLGISVSVIDDLISELIEENQLAYRRMTVRYEGWPRSLPPYRHGSGAAILFLFVP